MPDRQYEFLFPLTNDQLDALFITISKQRLKKYLLAAGFNKQKTIDLYRWNSLVSECLYFPLQCVEISLRNAINTTLCDLFTKEWHQCSSFQGILDHDRIQDIEYVIKRLTNRKKDIDNDQVVADLSFGFWTCLLESRYYEPIWRTHLRTAFPHLPNGRSLKSTHRRGKEILELRNRVAHHEPLLHRDLLKEHSNLIEFVSWLCPHTSDWIRTHSELPRVIRMRP